jgi:hypothetical protein
MSSKRKSAKGIKVRGLKRLDLETVDTKEFSMLVMGKTKCGKSYFARDILYQLHEQNYFKEWYLISKTEEVTHSFGIFPRENVMNKIDLVWLKNLIKTYRLAALHGQPVKPCMIVFDDVMGDPKLHSKTVRKLFTRGRHYKIGCIVLLQSFNRADIHFNIRKNVTAIGICRPQTESDAKTLVNDYLYIPGLKKAQQELLLQNYFKQTHDFLFIDTNKLGTARQHADFIYLYRARDVPTNFSLQSSALPQQFLVQNMQDLFLMSDTFNRLATTDDTMETIEEQSFQYCKQIRDQDARFDFFFQNLVDQLQPVSIVDTMEATSKLGNQEVEMLNLALASQCPNATEMRMLLTNSVLPVPSLVGLPLFTPELASQLKRNNPLMTQFDIVQLAVLNYNCRPPVLNQQYNRFYLKKSLFDFQVDITLVKPNELNNLDTERYFEVPIHSTYVSKLYVIALLLDRKTQFCYAFDTLFPHPDVRRKKCMVKVL